MLPPLLTLAVLLVAAIASSCSEDALGELRRDRDGSARNFPGRRQDDPGPPLVAAGASAQALQSMAEATCARRQRCGWLRGDEKACVERARMDLVADIHSERCATIDATALRRCLDRIAEEGCDDLLGTFRRALACRTGAVCGGRR